MDKLKLYGLFKTIALSRPDKFNAINGDMYTGLPKLFEEADADDATRVIVLTGKGKYYSSGNDLSSFKLDKPLSELAPLWSATLREFVRGFIDVNKPVIAAVNGPAIGIACTTLGLCDIVIASDAAAFNTPLIHLPQDLRRRPRQRDSDGRAKVDGGGGARLRPREHARPRARVRVRREQEGGGNGSLPARDAGQDEEADPRPPPGTVARGQRGRVRAAYREVVVGGVHERHDEL